MPWSAWWCSANSTLSAGVCVWSVGAPYFSARGEMRRTVASSGAHRPHPSLREHPPRSFAHTPHAPALASSVLDHPSCWCGVSLGSRSACAAQQDTPIPSFPERRKNASTVKVSDERWNAELLASTAPVEESLGELYRTYKLKTQS